ncbi:hypothetical protein ACFWII_23035 [Streptomyces sp. NPDC127063]
MTRTPTPHAWFRQQNLDQSLTTEFGLLRVSASRETAQAHGEAAREQAPW